jgi:heptosyltransferase-2
MVMTEFAKKHTKIEAVAPGSVWNTKQWGDDRYRSLVDGLQQNGVGVVLIGGKAEAEFAKSLVPSDNVLNLIGQVSMTESAGAIANSDLLVANDSAPLHLATAVGRPAIGIFGPTVPEAGFGPQSAGSIVIQESLWCRPCTSHGSMECPIYTHECMRRITVDRVLDQVLSMLR